MWCLGWEKTGHFVHLSPSKWSVNNLNCRHVSRLMKNVREGPNVWIVHNSHSPLNRKDADPWQLNNILSPSLVTHTHTHNSRFIDSDWGVHCSLGLLRSAAQIHGASMRNISGHSSLLWPPIIPCLCPFLPCNRYRSCISSPELYVFMSIEIGWQKEEWEVWCG